MTRKVVYLAHSTCDRFEALGLLAKWWQSTKIHNNTQLPQIEYPTLSTIPALIVALMQRVIP